MTRTVHDLSGPALWDSRNHRVLNTAPAESFCGRPTQGPATRIPKAGIRICPSCSFILARLADKLHDLRQQGLVVDGDDGWTFRIAARALVQRGHPHETRTAPTNRGQPARLRR